MRRVFILLLVAVALGAASFALCYQWARPVAATVATGTPAELDWLRSEFALTPVQSDRVTALHREYMPVCAGYCARFQEARTRLDTLLRSGVTWKSDTETVMAELADIRRECHLSLLRYAYDVAACMSPDQGRRYLNLIREQVLQGDPTGMLTGTR